MLSKSYPYLQIANKYGLSYSQVLILAHRHVHGDILPGCKEALTAISATLGEDKGYEFQGDMVDAYRTFERAKELGMDNV